MDLIKDVNYFVVFLYYFQKNHKKYRNLYGFQYLADDMRLVLNDCLSTLPSHAHS